MIVVRFKVRCQPGKTEHAMALMQDVIAPSRALDGVISFDIGRDIADPDAIIAVEVFADRDALDRQEALPRWLGDERPSRARRHAARSNLVRGPYERGPRMSRRRVAAMSAVGAAAVAATALLASPATAGARNSHRETLKFHDVTTASAFIDRNGNGTPDVGDALTFHEEDRRSTNIVEYNDSQCLVALDAEFLCYVVVTVHGRGEIVLDAAIAAPGGNFPDDFDLAVTGGTGDFATVRGTAHAHHVSDTASDDTLFLTR